MAPFTMYRQADSDKHTMYTPGITRRPAAGLTSKGYTRFRHNKVVCSVCDDDDRNYPVVAGQSSSAQRHGKTASCRLPPVQKGNRLMEVPKTCDRQTVTNTYWRRHDAKPWASTSCLPASLPVHTENWIKKDQNILAREEIRMQQQKVRDAYYRERHERLAPKKYKNDLKQAERDDRAGKYNTQLPRPLTKEEQYAEELRLARVGFNKQRKKCAVNKPLHSTIPPMPVDPPTGSINVEISAHTEFGIDGRVTKLFTGDEARVVHEKFLLEQENEPERPVFERRPTETNASTASLVVGSPSSLPRASNVDSSSKVKGTRRSQGAPTRSSRVKSTRPSQVKGSQPSIQAMKNTSSISNAKLQTLTPEAKVTHSSTHSMKKPSSIANARKKTLTYNDPLVTGSHMFGMPPVLEDDRNEDVATESHSTNWKRRQSMVPHFDTGDQTRRKSMLPLIGTANKTPLSMLPLISTAKKAGQTWRQAARTEPRTDTATAGETRRKSMLPPIDTATTDETRRKSMHGSTTD